MSISSWRSDICFSLFIGWAFADSALHRLLPLWVGARGLEFTWEHILQGLEANANLVSNFLGFEHFMIKKLVISNWST